MTAEVQKYTREQIEALELAPGTEHEALEGWVPTLATDDDLQDRSRKGLRLSRRRHPHAQIRREDRSLHLQSPNRRHAGRLLGAILRAQRARQAQSLATPTSPASNSAAKTAPPASTGKTGSRPGTKRKPPAKRTSPSIPTRSSSRQTFDLSTFFRPSEFC